MVYDLGADSKPVLGECVYRVTSGCPWDAENAGGGGGRGRGGGGGRGEGGGGVEGSGGGNGVQDAGC